jgi:hypothetical protein
MQRQIPRSLVSSVELYGSFVGPSDEGTYNGDLGSFSLWESCGKDVHHNLWNEVNSVDCILLGPGY